jgi:hypothetical protein
MRKFAAILGLAVGMILLTPSGANASHDPSGAPFAEDFAVGSYDAGALRFDFSAHSGPSGEGPAGSFKLVFGEPGFPPLFDFDTSVTCLHVESHDGVIGVASGPNGGPGGTIVAVHDGTGASSDPFDLIGFFDTPQPPGTSCPAPSSLPPLLPFSTDFWGEHFYASLGAQHDEITVHDAVPLPTSKDQCRSGGWRDFDGFENQGDCVSFVATKGKNPPGGH